MQSHLGVGFIAHAGVAVKWCPLSAPWASVRGYETLQRGSSSPDSCSLQSLIPGHQVGAWLVHSQLTNFCIIVNIPESRDVGKMLGWGIGVCGIVLPDSYTLGCWGEFKVSLQSCPASTHLILSLTMRSQPFLLALTTASPVLVYLSLPHPCPSYPVLLCQHPALGILSSLLCPLSPCAVMSISHLQSC